MIQNPTILRKEQEFNEWLQYERSKVLGEWIEQQEFKARYKILVTIERAEIECNLLSQCQIGGVGIYKDTASIFPAGALAIWDKGWQRIIGPTMHGYLFE